MDKTPLRKTWVIAKREYLAAVKTKSFLISLVLLPLMMSGGFFAQKATQKIGDSSTKRIAIIDRTPGANLVGVVEAAAERRNTSDVFDKNSGKQMKAKFVFERVEPASIDDETALLKQRFELSQRVRTSGLFAFVEIGNDVLSPKVMPTTRAAASATQMADMNIIQKLEAVDAMLGDNNQIRYTSNRPTYNELRTFLETSLNPAIYQRRMSAANLPAAQVMPLLTPPRVASRGLVALGADGNYAEDSQAGMVTAYIVPFVLLMLMFIIVLVGTSPMTTNVVEEKQMRIAEVLLGSVRPFELMMGKLLGGVGLALTLAIIYLGGAIIAAKQYGMAHYVSTPVLVWFLVFTVLGVMMYGSMFVAAGAAVTNVKEAQTLITPVMLLILLPLFAVGPMLQDPSGPLPTFVSFFPLATPMMMTARIAIPPGIPAWQIAAGVAISLVTTAVLVWCAGRIFRVGILMQGQGAKFGEMMRWVLRG